jgi:trans-aconitate methyltransferase
MEPTQIQHIFQALYANQSGYEIAQREKNRLGRTEQSTTYGEVVPESFAELVAAAEPAEGEVFIDLGSGTGKATFMAALSFPFSRVLGVELLPGLGELARQLLARYDAEFRPHLPEQRQRQRIEFVDGDFLELDLSSVDVVFAHATCFAPELVAQLGKKLEELKPGARVIVAGNTINSPALKFRAMKIMKADWGTALTAIYQRT